jgi:hypothetical protein
MKDTGGSVKSQYTDYYGKDINYIVKEITLETIDITTTWATPSGLTPSITITNALTGIRDLMDMVPGFLVWNGTNFVYTEPNLGSVDHAITASDSVWVSIDQGSAVVPNRVYVEAVDLETEQEGESSPIIHTGNHTNPTSISRTGLYIDRHYQDYSGSLTSDSDCDDVAEAIMTKIEASATRGNIFMLNQLDISLIDTVTCTDVRGNTIEAGTVYGIKRTYDRGEYTLEIEIGGVQGSSIPDGSVPPPNINVPPISPSHIQEFAFNPAYLPITIDITFTAEDDDEVSWDAGNIYTADGTAWTVLASVSNQTLSTSDLYYAYYDTNLVSGDGNYQKLQWTTTFSDTVPHGKLLVAFAKKSSESTVDCMIVTAEGGSHSVFSYVTKLSAIAADIGLITAGEIRVGTGTLGSNFTGWRLWVESSVGRMAGYNGDTIQWYSGTDGKMYCGGGDVRLDTSGIRLVGEMLAFFYGATPTSRGTIAGTTDSLTMTSDNNMDIEFLSGDEVLVKGTNNVVLESTSGHVQAKNDIIPNANSSLDLGSTSLEWDCAYIDDIYTDTGIHFGAGTSYALIDLAGNLSIEPPSGEIIDMGTVDIYAVIDDVSPTSDKLCDLGDDYCFDNVYADDFYGDIDDTWEPT